jgi:hypothetical protein
VIVLCDRLFREAIGADCGGPAEDRYVGERALPVGPVLDRFEAGPDRWMSVYAIR